MKPGVFDSYRDVAVVLGRTVLILAAFAGLILGGIWLLR